MKNIKSRGFEDANGSGNITWTGECIPCLGIKPDQNLNVITAIIANKVCELAAPLDLSSLTLQGALDIFNKQEPVNRTIVNVLQLLLDNEVGLKELIDNIQGQIDGLSTTHLVLDLKCLKQVDGFGNPLPYTNQSVLQSLINEVCALDSSVADLSGKYTVLKNRVDNLNIPSGDEPLVTTCISGPKEVSLSLVDVANDYCEYKQDVGTTAQIQTAIARQVAKFNTLMSGVQGWVVPSNPANFSLAQSISNMWLVLDNYFGRITANELCCGSSCDDITLGFIGSIEGDSIILKFTSGAGTFIPTGFTDCGSTLTITDEFGTSTSVNIVVSQGGETDEIDLSMFTMGSVLDFNIDLKMCSADNTCQKCINKNIKYLNSACCTITNTGNEQVTIIYQTLASSV